MSEARKRNKRKSQWNKVNQITSITKRYRDDTNYDMRIEGPGHRLIKKVMN